MLAMYVLMYVCKGIVNDFDMGCISDFLSYTGYRALFKVGVQTKWTNFEFKINYMATLLTLHGYCISALQMCVRNLC